MKKKGGKPTALLLALACALCACVFSGCAEETPPAESAPAAIIGFSQLGAESAWRVANTNSIRQAGANAGMQVMYENAFQKQDEQIKAIRTFIAYRVDAIVIAPVVETGWDDVLKEAKAAGIPVILEDRSIQTDLPDMYVSWIGADFYNEGEKAAEFLLKKFPGTKDQINIVEITGNDGSSPAMDRSAGFSDVLSSHGNFRILTSQSGDFMISKGREVMQNILNTYNVGEIDVVFSHNDDMTLGAIQAMEDAGIRPGTDIVIVTVDAQQKIIDLLKAGKVNCAVECNPDIGETVIGVVQKVLDGQPVPEKVYSEEGVFTEYDDPATLPDRDY